MRVDTVGWKWCVFVDVESDASVAVSVEAEGRSLVEASAPRAPLEALTAVMAALASFDEGDAVTVVVRGKHVPLSSWTGANAYAALYWLATTLSHACCTWVSPMPPAQWPRWHAERTRLRS